MLTREGLVTCSGCGASFPQVWIKHPQVSGAKTKYNLYFCCNKCLSQYEIKLMREEIAAQQKQLELNIV